MILIADSGSSKTTWVLLNNAGNVTEQYTTSGINPFFQNEDDIYYSIINELKLSKEQLSSVFFYGAGITNPEKRVIVLQAINRALKPLNIVVESDLLCAARALYGNKPGIAAILGTGSNSCYYDGNKIVQNVSPLGYILGDEGSGAVLGKKLVSDILKKQLPEYLINSFFDEHKILPNEIMDRVYRHPFPNRYLAQYTRFLLNNIHDESIYKLVRGSFIEFFLRNIKQYNQPNNLKVSFTGSVAWYFSKPLHEAATETGYTIYKIAKDPIDGLIKYHNTIKEK